MPGRLRFATGTLARCLLATVVVCAAAAAAAACGDDAGPAQPQGGGFAYVDDRAVAVAVMSLRAEDLERATRTLDRLPIWGLVQAQLPGRSGRQIRRFAGEELVDGLVGDERAAEVSFRDDVEPWLGDRAGFALLGEAVEEPHSLEGDTPPTIAWLDSSDDERARRFLRQLLGEDAERTEHDGVEIWSGSEDDEPVAADSDAPAAESSAASSLLGGSAVFVEHGALVIASSVAQAEALLDSRGDDKRFFDDEARQQLLDVHEGTEHVAAVASLDRVLDLAAAAAEGEAGDGHEDAEGQDASEGAGSESDDADATVRDAAELLRDERLRDALPDDIGFALGVDDIGLWMDYSWTPAATPSIDDARELAERLPADALSVQAQGARSHLVEQAPEIWAATREAFEVEDMAQLADRCPAEDREICTLAARFGAAFLEGDLLERLQEQAGDNAATATAQWANVSGARAEQRIGSVSRVEDPDGMLEMTQQAVNELAPAVDGYGFQLQTARRMNRAGPDRLEVTARVRTGSETARALRTDTDFTMSGFADLLSAEGMTMELRTVDDNTLAIALPSRVMDPLLNAWAGRAEQIGEAERYQRDVTVSGAPEQTSYWGWSDIAGSIMQALAAVPEARQAEPIVRNNLEQVGGALSWSERIGDDDEVGVIRILIPIHDD